MSHISWKSIKNLLMDKISVDPANQIVTDDTLMQKWWSMKRFYSISNSRQITWIICFIDDALGWKWKLSCIITSKHTSKTPACLYGVGLMWNTEKSIYSIYLQPAPLHLCSCLQFTVTDIVCFFYCIYLCACRPSTLLYVYFYFPENCIQIPCMRAQASPNKLILTLCCTEGVDFQAHLF